MLIETTLSHIVFLLTTCWYWLIRCIVYYLCSYYLCWIAVFFPSLNLICQYFSSLNLICQQQIQTCLDSFLWALPAYWVVKIRALSTISLLNQKSIKQILEIMQLLLKTSKSDQHQLCCCFFKATNNLKKTTATTTISSLL